VHLRHTSVLDGDVLDTLIIHSKPDSLLRNEGGTTAAFRSINVMTVDDNAEPAQSPPARREHDVRGQFTSSVLLKKLSSI
jgi:hypothetical protein